MRPCLLAPRPGHQRRRPRRGDSDLHPPEAPRGDALARLRRHRLAALRLQRRPPPRRRVLH